MLLLNTSGFKTCVDNLYKSFNQLTIHAINIIT